MIENQPFGVTPKTPMSDMATRLWPGGPLRDALLAQVTEAVRGLDVGVSIVQVGHDAASDVYIRRKLMACAAVGITAQVTHLEAAEGEEALHTLVERLAADPKIHGIIVQTPLPAGWDVTRALDAVPVQKDIDGLSSGSRDLRRMGAGNALLPATPLGVMRLLTQMGVTVMERRIGVVGKGMVGAPLRDMLEAAGAHIAAIDKDTPAPATHASTCDVLVSAAGVPGLITGAWVKPGAVVIDVGITRLEGRIFGDVARDSVDGIAGILTPVPGGVGPMTVASLLTNIADAACLQLGRPRTLWVIDAARAA